MARTTRLLTAALAILALVATACQSEAGNRDPGDPAGAETAVDQLGVAVASFDLAVGDGRRLMTGLFTLEREPLAFGEVTFDVGYLGEQQAGTFEAEQTVTASFLPVPGREPSGESASPVLLTDGRGTGVYTADVDLQRAGFWGLRVTAELADGTVLSGTTGFQVLDEPEVPAVGDEAPRTDNLTLADVEEGRAEPVALDSRAQGEDPQIPDQHLHRRSIAAALDEGRPVVAVFSTPVYCRSQFCGPLVEVISDLALRYEDRADFVMVEVWQDFEAGLLNDAAAAWIQTETGGNEPWVFLIEGNGTIAARWDNVLDVAELEQLLEEMPATPSLDDS